MNMEHCSFIEQVTERGKNITIEIDLVRHPEKDPETGNISTKGEKDFQEMLRSVEERGFDAHRVFVSTHKRPQQVGQLAEISAKSGINVSVRTREQLLPHAGKITQEMAASLRQLAIDREIISSEAKASVSGSSDAVSDPAEESERGINTVALQEYYDDLFPGTSTPFSGKDIGESLDAFVQRLSGMAKHFNSGSRVKMTLVSHSGFIEFFIKLAYLRAHPEESAESLTAEKIGGLLGFNEGPKILVRTDNVGNKTVTFVFRNMTFELE